MAPYDYVDYVLPWVNISQFIMNLEDSVDQVKYVLGYRISLFEDVLLQPCLYQLISSPTRPKLS